MTCTITSNCIGCQRCRFECPTGAIATNGTDLWIDPDRCNHCEGYFSVPQCWSVCPTNDGCQPYITEAVAVALHQTQTEATDYWERWFKRYNRIVARLKAKRESEYWHQWFDSYTHSLEHLKATYARSPDAALMP